MWKMAQTCPRMRQLTLEIPRLVSESENGLLDHLQEVSAQPGEAGGSVRAVLGRLG